MLEPGHLQYRKSSACETTLYLLVVATRSNDTIQPHSAFKFKNSGPTFSNSLDALIQFSNDFGYSLNFLNKATNSKLIIEEKFTKDFSGEKIQLSFNANDGIVDVNGFRIMDSADKPTGPIHFSIS